jgi:DNA-3-methyladenine glycosylase II
MANNANSQNAHKFLLTTSKKKGYYDFYDFLLSTETISLESRIDKSLTLELFLIKTIIGQQVSVKAAQSIWNRTNEYLTDCNNKISLNSLKKLGLSAPKASYILGITRNKNIKSLNKSKLKKFSDEELSSFFLNIKGVGPWTLGAIKIFYLNSPDIYLNGDLAIQKKSLEYFGSFDDDMKDFSPYRTYLCLYLWKSTKN